MRLSNILKFFPGLALIASVLALWSCTDGSIVENKVGRSRFEVYIDTDGGYPSSFPTQIFYSSGRIVKPSYEPTKRGHRFVGWTCDYEESAEGNVFDFTTVVRAYRQVYHLRAMWEEAFEVYLDAGTEGGYFTYRDGRKVRYDTVFVAKNVPMNTPAVNPGFDNTEGEKKEFYYWYSDPGGASEDAFNFNTTEITGDMTLYAIYAEAGELLTVTYDSRGGTALPVKLGIASGTIMEEPAAPTKTITYPVEGEEPIVRTPAFRYWVDDEGRKFDFSEPLLRNANLHAVWEPLPDEAFDIDESKGYIKAVRSPYVEVEEHYDLPEKVGGVTIVGFIDAIPVFTGNITDTNPRNFSASYELASPSVFTHNQVIQSAYMPPTYTRLGQFTFAGAVNMKRAYFYGIVKIATRTSNQTHAQCYNNLDYAHQPFALSGLEEIHLPSTLVTLDNVSIVQSCPDLVKAHFHGADPITIPSYVFNVTSLKVVIFDKQAPPDIVNKTNIFGTSVINEIWVPYGRLQDYLTADSWAVWTKYLREQSY